MYDKNEQPTKEKIDIFYELTLDLLNSKSKVINATRLRISKAELFEYDDDQLELDNTKLDSQLKDYEEVFERLYNMRESYGPAR